MGKKGFIDHVTVLIASGCSRLILLVSTIFVARMVGVSDFGLFTVFYLALTIASILPRSLDTTFIKLARAEVDRKEIFFAASVVMKSCYVASVVCLGLIVLMILSELGAARYIVIGAMAGSFLCFSQSAASIYQEQERFFRYSLVELLFSGVIFLAIGLIYFLPVPLQIGGVLVVYSSISVSIGLVILIYLQIKTGIIAKAEKSAMWTMYDLGKWVIGITICMFLFPRVDVFLLSSFVPLEDVGVYGVASQLMMSVGLLVRSMSNVILPKAMNALKSRNSMLQYLKSTLGSVLLVIIVIIFMMVFSEFIINFTYGVNFIDAVLPFRVLLLGTIFTTLYIPFSFLYYTADVPQTRFWLELGKFVFGVIMVLVLLYRYGIVGAAIGMTVTNIVYSMLSFVVISKRIRKHFIFQTQKVKA